MKAAIIFFMLLATIVIQTLASETINNEKTKYTTKFDNVNLDEILKSDRLLKNYVDCLLDKKPCTSDGAELKKNLPDAISNDCSKCTELQKDGSEKVMHYLIDNKPEWWKELEIKYDAGGSYKKKYLEGKNETNNSEAENVEDE